MKNKILETGSIAQHTAAADIVAGEIVVLNATTARIGISCGNIATDAVGDVDTAGVFELTKNTASDAFAVGETIKVAANKVLKIAGTGTPDVVVCNAYVFAASATLVTTVSVKLLG